MRHIGRRVCIGAGIHNIEAMESDSERPRTEIPANPPAFNVPPVTLATAGVLVAVFGLLALGPDSLAAATLHWLAFRPIRIVYAFHEPLHGQTLIAVLSLLTHALIHFDFAHLALNVGFLLAFGAACERVFGPRRFAAILVLSAIAGAAAKFAVDWNAPVYMIGASGAVFGCMGGFIRLMLGGPPRMRRRGLLLLLALVIANVVLTVMGPQLLGVDGRIAWDAHIGGFVAGMLLGWPPRRRMRQAAV